MSIANAPSKDIKDLIEGHSSFAFTFGTDLFVASIPNKPDNALCIYDTGGWAQGQYALERPNVQIRLRNLDYATGYALMRDIKYFLHYVQNGITINGTRYISIEARSEILFLGQDDKNRYEWTINFQIIRSGE